MLRVARIRDRTGRYYLMDLASELDAASVGPGPTDPRDPRGGRWLGTAAAGLGLAGHVDGQAFSAVLSGRHPSGGHRLRMRETAVSGYDLTFAAPKSVSVLFALGSPGASAAARAAHDEAVDAAMGYVAARAATVRCTPSASPVDGLVAARFVHGVSRALDPHLHSHVVVANLARGNDGRWRAIDGRGLYAHAKAAGALYDAFLRHGITTRLGLEWVSRSGRGWELSAVDPFLTAALSSRRAEILVHLATHASGPAPGLVPTPTSRRARRTAWAATRDPKAVAATPGELRRRWGAIARGAGCSAELFVNAALERAGAGRVGRASIDEHRFAAAIAEGAGRGVTRREAIGAWAGALGAGGSVEDVERCVDMLADWGTGTGVAERVLAPAAVVPAPHVLRLLGPRPAAPHALGVWESAASSIARYRARWGVHDRRQVLGAHTPTELRALPARRLADHLATARAIDDALARIGRVREPLRDRGLELSRDLR
ncbi:MAG: relaxase domain-containing protein [Actinomycetota bacterium]|nr:relaxase domain-containing protein [Actinomycetota bacterium]